MSTRPTTCISLTDLPKALITYADVFSSKGPRGLQGSTGPPGKAGKRVTDLFILKMFESFGFDLSVPESRLTNN